MDSTVGHLKWDEGASNPGFMHLCRQRGAGFTDHSSLTGEP